MEEATLLIAIVASFTILIVQPIYSIVLYIAALAWYPSYLSVSVGTIDFTVCRIVILAIFAKLFLRTKLPGQFKFIWLDKLVVIYFFCQILSGVFTTKPLTAFLENRAGAVFDMVLPYFAIRMIVTSRKEYLTLLKSILIIAAPLAIVGFYQCLTGNAPLGFLNKYWEWKSSKGYAPMMQRHGFFRADVVFSHPIMYGLFFAMFGPVCAGILHNTKKHKTLCWLGLVLMGLGVFSSMSSGPMLAGLLAVLFIAFYRWRKYWKTVVIVIIIMCGLVEIISNRHFYDILGGFTLSPATAWYRSKLIDVALFEGGMSGHWLTGWGYFIDPGWGLRIDGRGTDAVNHYLLILACYGLIGLVPFLAINIAVIQKLVSAYKASTLDSDKWQIWCLTSGLFGLWSAFMSVSLFGQPTTIYYMMIAFAGAMTAIVNQRHGLSYMPVSNKYSQKMKKMLKHNLQEP